MRRIMAGLWLLIIVVSPIHGSSAQQGASYQLRTPSAREYLIAAPEIIEQWRLDYRNVYSPYDLQAAIEQELTLRYPDLAQEPSTLIANTYSSMVSTAYGILDHGWWNQQIIESWLRHHPIDLASFHDLQFLTYDVKISPRDFDGDGVDEYVLDVTGDMYQQLVVVKGTAETGYHIVETPLEWFGFAYAYWDNHSGGLEPLYFGDLNADGLPEWVLAFGGVGANHTVIGHLEILSWQDGKLVNLAGDTNSFDPDTLGYIGPAPGGHPIIPYFIHWNVAQLDDDPAQEIQQRQEFEDNWGCKFVETRAFDWDATTHRYKFVTSNRVFEDSAECAVRDAQDAMWKEDWVSAIGFYNYALDLWGQNSVASHLEVYVHLRLALAYGLVDDLQSADFQIEALENLEALMFRPEVELLEGAITNYRQHPTALALCLSVFQYYSIHLDSAVRFGNTEDIPVPVVSLYSPSPRTAEAGCDAGQVLDEVLTNHTFTTNQSVIEQLATLGASPIASQSFDLNGDGQDEWLVWLHNWLDPIFFAPDGEVYHISRPPIRTPDDMTTLITYPLPNGQSAFVQFYFVEFYRDEMNYLPDPYLKPFYCHFDPTVSSGSSWRGYLNLWGLDRLELYPVSEMYLCDELSLNEILPNPGPLNEIEGWALIEEPPHDEVASTFIWDTESAAYIPIPKTDTILPISNEPITDLAWELNQAQWRWVYSHDLEGALQALTAAIDEKLAEASLLDQQAAYYWLALMSEMNGQPDDALKAYVQVVNLAPQSAWGWLAGLHLETLE
ncbi:MAG: hypothetical protein K8L91_18695 [Anaerolineae bacterium]|nr:hypothetical protein [Anaerolineae bacterium]